MLPELIAEQVKAIQNLKIDKITAWDSGTGKVADGSGSSTSTFLRSLIGSLPPIHELAEQAGINLPGILGQITETQKAGSGDQAAGQKPVTKGTATGSSIPGSTAPTQKPVPKK